LYRGFSLAGADVNQQPDHSQISQLRRRNLEALSGLVLQSLRLCQKAGMVSLGAVSWDGSPVKAKASKHKAMGQERMRMAERAGENAEAPRELAMEIAALAGLEPSDLGSLESSQLPSRGLAHQADGTPTTKTQGHHRCAEGIAYTEPDSSIRTGNGKRQW
jgi:hypothetical protein